MHRPIRLAMIYGSTRPGRFCDTVGRWAAAQIEGRGAFRLDVIDPAALAPAAKGQGANSTTTLALDERIRQADAFMVVTPEYNHSYPAPLKALIDSVYAGWQAKPVAFVCYGGVSGGLRAVEHLRHVFAELHAVAIRDTVSFANARDQFDAQGALRNPEPAAKAMTIMLARLAWWVVALRNAREASAYVEAA